MVMVMIHCTNVSLKLQACLYTVCILNRNLYCLYLGRVMRNCVEFVTIISVIMALMLILIEDIDVLVCAFGERIMDSLDALCLLRVCVFFVHLK